MTPIAAEWDRKHRNSVEHHTVKDGKFIPINRPCDWCGRAVAEGWIHPECAKKEREMLLDIFG